jgi:hypothetical protein
MPGEISQEMGQVSFFLVAENGLHPRQGRHFRWGSLSIAAGDPDGCFGVLPGQAADSLAGLLVGTFGDGAAVHDHQVRVGPRGRSAPPQTRELSGHSGRVTLVHLAAEGDDMEKTVPGSGFRVFGSRFSVFGGHFQGLRLKESNYQVLIKVLKKELQASIKILSLPFAGAVHRLEACATKGDGHGGPPHQPFHVVGVGHAHPTFLLTPKP